MSSNTADVFKSHHEVMEALHQNFAGTDDAQKAKAVDHLRGDIAMACQAQQDDIKSTISGQPQKNSRNCPVPGTSTRQSSF